ncbi:MAG: hypothetical protein HWN68_16060 [Desulfobacterales bacterium]|nr:hypothetical protein [Desulfobacterales bacterium]
MSFIKSKTIPLVITVIVAIFMLLEYYFPVPGIKSTAKTIRDWAVIIAAFALGLGAANLLRIHSLNIQRRTTGIWPFSIWLIFMLLLFFVVGVTLSIEHTAYKWIYQNGYLVLYASVFSLISFYVITSFYRAMSIRSIETSILIVCAIFAMLKNTPAAVAFWPGFETIGTWLLDVPNASVHRAAILTAAIGSIALSIRVLMGRERAQLAE